MPDFLLNIDKALFQVLNGHLVSAPTDFLFPILTSIHIIWPVYLLLAFYLIYTHRAKGIYALISLAMVLGIACSFLVVLVNHSLQRMLSIMHVLQYFSACFSLR
jgi:hypothetical protein